MFKKFSYLILAAAILVSGYVALNKLNYWERSVRIFSIKNQNFEGRRGRGQFGNEGFRDRGDRDGFDRSGIRDLPDSIRFRFGEEGSPVIRDRNFPDSLRAGISTTVRRQMTRDRNRSDSIRQQRGRNNRELSGRSPYEEGIRNGQGRRRGDFRGGQKIYLKNVLWFLAVFASFTALTIYIDKGYVNLWKNKSK